MSNTFNEIMALPLARVAAAATQWGVPAADKAKMAHGLADLVDGGSLTIAAIRALTASPAAARPTPAAPVAADPAAAAVASKAHNAAMEAQTRIGVAETRMDVIERVVNRVRQQGDDSAAALKGIAATVDQISDTLTRQERAIAAMPAIDTAGIPAQVAAAIDAAFKPFRSVVEAAGKQAEVADLAAGITTTQVDADTLFGVQTGLAVKAEVYGHPDAPVADPCFIWQPIIVRHLLQSQVTGENVWLGGEKGTGKTQTVQQFAAVTGRPFTRINFHKYTTTEEYIGAVGLSGGDTAFVPGPFLRAFTTPGAVILLDEVSNCDPGELATLNGLLEPGAAVTIAGQVWRRAPGVLVFAADNTLGAGDASGRYSGTRVMNSALLDRFARSIPFGFLPLDVEIDAVVKHTGCHRDLAAHVLAAVTVCRGKVATGHLVDAPSIRQVVAFIRALSFHAVRDAWDTTIAAKQPPEGLIELEAVFQSSINPTTLHKYL